MCLSYLWEMMSYIKDSYWASNLLIINMSIYICNNNHSVISFYSCLSVISFSSVSLTISTRIDIIEWRGHDFFRRWEKRLILSPIRTTAFSITALFIITVYHLNHSKWWAISESFKMIWFELTKIKIDNQFFCLVQLKQFN